MARLLEEFGRLRERFGDRPGRPNLSDVLRSRGGARFGLPLQLRSDRAEFTFPELGRYETDSVPLLRDGLSGMRYVFAVLPIAYIVHDERINPRAIATQSLRRLAEEFAAGRPQLHPALAWASVQEGRTRSAIGVFDGQHKIAAQVLLGVTELPLRIFINPDIEVLLAANTRAATALRQVAFDTAARRRLGSQRYAEFVDRFLLDKDLPLDFRGFSERELASHFAGRRAEVRRALLDDVREAITYHPENRLRAYIATSPADDRPLGLATLERAVYARFISPELLDLQTSADSGPRGLERQQLVRLLNLIAAHIYDRGFDTGIGSRGLERRLDDAPDAVPSAHLRACRMSDPGAFTAWVGLVHGVVVRYAEEAGGAVAGPLLVRLPAEAWRAIEATISRIAALPLWTVVEDPGVLFSARRGPAFWEHVFRTGATPDGRGVISSLFGEQRPPA